MHNQTNISKREYKLIEEKNKLQVLYNVNICSVVFIPWSQQYLYYISRWIAQINSNLLHKWVLETLNLVSLAQGINYSVVILFYNDLTICGKNTHFFIIAFQKNKFYLFYLNAALLISYLITTVFVYIWIDNTILNIIQRYKHMSAILTSPVCLGASLVHWY